jgi:hypothetical protein
MRRDTGDWWTTWAGPRDTATRWAYARVDTELQLVLQSGAEWTEEAIGNNPGETDAAGGGFGRIAALIFLLDVPRRVL